MWRKIYPSLDLNGLWTYTNTAEQKYNKRKFKRKAAKLISQFKNYVLTMDEKNSATQLEMVSVDKVGSAV